MVNVEGQFVSMRTIKTRVDVWVCVHSLVTQTPNIGVWATCASVALHRDKQHPREDGWLQRRYGVYKVHTDACLWVCAFGNTDTSGANSFSLNNILYIYIY